MLRFGLKILLPCLLLISTPVHAADLRFQDLLRQALEANPELRQAKSAWVRRQTEIPAMSALPDPMLEMGLQSFEFARFSLGTEPMSGLSVMVSQELPYPPKLDLRAQLAAVEADMAWQSWRMRTWVLYRDLRIAYSDVLYQDAALAALAEIQILLKQMVRLTELNLSVGKALLADVLKARLELGMLSEREIMLTQRRNQAVITLQRLLGDASLTGLEQARFVPLPTVSLPALAELSKQLEKSPELLEARLANRLSTLNADLAGLEGIPDPMLSGGVMLRGPLPAMWTLQIGVPLPVFAARKQTVMAEAAREAVTESEARTLAVRQRLLAGLRENLNMLESELKQQVLYERSLIPQARLTLDALLAGYVTGKVDFADLLEGWRVYLEYRLGVLERQRNAQQAQAMIEELLAASLSAPALEKEIEPR